MAAIPEVTPTAFQSRWPEGERREDVVLLDVREPHELALASIDGVLHIPMAQVPARLAELDRDKPIVVMCRTGGRSRKVAEYLAANGFEQVFNLQGGIDAWSQEIDPRIPRY